jgi:hypothetical protein
VIPGDRYFSRTEPLVQKISKLETENKQLQKDLDALEQYGRRSLVRISGLSERATGDETTTAVRKIMESISALTALDIFIISSSVMDIFCDNSGCTNSIASAISLLFEELVSESARESKDSDLAFFMSTRL